MLIDDSKTGLFNINSEEGEYDILFNSIETHEIEDNFSGRLDKLDLVAKASLSMKQEKTAYLKIPVIMWARETNSDLDNLEDIQENYHDFCLQIKSYWYDFQNSIINKMTGSHLPVRPLLLRGDRANFHNTPLRQSSMPFTDQHDTIF